MSGKHPYLSNCTFSVCNWDCRPHGRADLLLDLIHTPVSVHMFSGWAAETFPHISGCDPIVCDCEHGGRRRWTAFPRSSSCPPHVSPPARVDVIYIISSSLEPLWRARVSFRGSWGFVQHFWVRASTFHSPSVNCYHGFQTRRVTLSVLLYRAWWCSAADVTPV